MNISVLRHIKYLLISLVMATSVSNAQTPIQLHGQLSVKGNKIIDKNGEPVQLQGMSMFWSQWMGKYYNYKTIKWLIEDWKCSVIRVAVGIGDSGYLQFPEIENKKITEVIDAAIELGIYVIIDWHDHNAIKHLNESQKFFVQMAKKYGKYPNIIYETYNEPIHYNWSDNIKPYHISVIDSIRKYDTKNIVLCGTPNWDQEIDKAAADPINLPNIAYTVHYYADTHKQWLRDRVTDALNKNIAVFISEYGTCDASGNGAINYAESYAWYKFMDDNKLSHCNWSVADKVETASILKPKASVDGNWSTNQITPSGLMVRAKLRGEPYAPAKLPVE